MTVENLLPEGDHAFLLGQIDEAMRSGEPLETVNLDNEGNKIKEKIQEVGWWCSISTYRRSLINSIES